ncbi:MAG: Slp family lipoprotein [Granulosicoccus sp.]|nr:Slp family lipoprotein [Granulosicoccus sp.]
MAVLKKMGRLIRAIAVAIAAWQLSACASGPFETDDGLSSLSVQEVREQMSASDSLDDQIAESVLWGGVILNTQNLVDGTQIEVMGYPLDRRQRPMLGRDPEGRFLVKSTDFLEPVDYAQGRSISLLGQISGVSQGTVGEAQYPYPTIEATEVHLWKENELPSKPRVTFGIGVNIGL